MTEHTHPSTVFIANPASGGGKGAKIMPEVARAMEAASVSHAMRETKAPGHATALAAEAVAEGFERIVALGGDGTIHEVVNGIVSADGRPEFGVIPVGTGNDFYRMVGGSPRLETALRILSEGNVRAFDVGRATWSGERRHFVNLIGFGIDVEVLRRRAAFKRLSGLPQYLAALLRALTTFKPVPLRLETTPRSWSDRALICTLTVGPTIGGGFRLAPDASPDDGLFDLCLIRPLGVLEVLTYIPKVIAGRHGSLPKVELTQVSGAVVVAEREGGFHFELDGELVPEPTDRVHIELLPQRLHVVVASEGMKTT